MSTLIDPNRRALDLTGAIMPGAKLYTYATGSSTPLATYQDEARSVANTNPVVADANGYFPRLFGVPGSLYREVLKTSADVTVKTTDNVASLESTTTSAASRLKQLVACPLDYGAIGDGTADDAVALQAAITAAIGAVDLAGKTYKCNSTLTIAKDNLEIRNGTIDFSSSSLTYGLYVGGTFVATTNLAANTLKGVRSVTATSGTGIVAGQIAVLKSGFTILTGACLLGEATKIAYVSGTAVTLEDPVESERGFLTADTATLSVYTPRRNIRFKRLRIIMGASSPTFAIGVFYSERVAIEDCDFTASQSDGYNASVMFSLGTYECSVIGTSFSYYGTSSFGKGVRTAGSRKTIIDRCNFAALGGGTLEANRGAVVVGYVNGTVQSHGTIISRCTFDQCVYGVNIISQCNDTSIDDCKFSDWRAALGYECRGVKADGRSVLISKSSFTMGNGKAIVASKNHDITAYAPSYEIVVRDTKLSSLVTGSPDESIELEGATSYPITRVVLKNISAIESASSRPLVRVAFATNCSIIDSKLALTRIDTVDSAIISACSFSDELMLVVDVLRSVIEDCEFVGTLDGFSADENCDNIRMARCIFIGGSGGHDAISNAPGSGSNDTMIVTDCVVSGSYRYPFVATSVDKVSIFGSRFSGSSGSAISSGSGDTKIRDCNFGALDITGDDVSVSGSIFGALSIAGTSQRFVSSKFAAKVTVASSTRVLFDGCEFVAAGDALDIGTSCSDVRISACMFDGNGTGKAIASNPSSGDNTTLIVSSCRIKDYEYGVYLDDTDRVAIVASEIHDCDKPVYCDNAVDDIRIEGCKILGKDGTTTDTGVVQIDNCANGPHIVGNLIERRGSNRQALRVASGSNAVVSANSIFAYTSTYDIVLWSAGSEVIFSSNHINSTSQYGINYGGTNGFSTGDRITSCTAGDTSGAGLTVSDAL